MLSSAVMTGILATYVAAETNSLSVERLIIKDPDLPKNFHNLRVVFISDLHHGTFSSSKRLRKMVQKINALEPDLILFGGDYVQTQRKNKNLKHQQASLDELTSILQNLTKPTLGMYSVSGNHDHWFGLAKVVAHLQKAGIKTIDNDGVALKKGDESIYLSGVGDLWCNQPDLKKALSHRDSQKFTLLLSHQPNFIDTLTKNDHINFVLAGHTHGGQCQLFGYQPLMPKRFAKWEYISGLIETPQTRMLVSPGIGTVLPYFRFFAPPKIHLLVFKRAPRLSKF
ncbi:MAG: metallophosphoesterase [bacterium]|nr:metallophosphoesterase [bacterium]